MNFRWVHAMLILLSALLAVLFGVWCLSRYGRQGGVGTLLAGVAAFHTRSHPVRKPWSI